MDQISSLKAFFSVVEHNSFSRAANELDMSVAKVSKLVQDLEHRLKTRLLHRTTRRITVTEAGDNYYHAMQPIVAEMATVDARMEQMAGVITGKLKMSLPLDYGRRLIVPRLAEFRAQHPDIYLDMDVSDRQVDMLAEGFDMAVRIASLKDSSLVARPLSEFQIQCAAAPEFLTRLTSPLSHPSQLETLPCITYALTAQPLAWRFMEKHQEYRQRVNSVCQLNNGDLIANLASQGVGVIYQPDFILQPYFERGLLEPVLEPYWGKPTTVFGVFPERQYLPMKVKAMMNFLAEILP